MGHIIDISKWNGNINWDVAAPQIDLAICRVQYGSRKVDERYKEYSTNLEQRGIPQAAYAYGMYISVNDAIVEADDFMARTSPKAKFLALDVEDDTLQACGAANLAKASQAFIDRCKSKGWKVGLYVSHHMYNNYGLSGVKADFLWLPRYGGQKPAYPCDLWQYTDTGYIDGIGKVDLNRLNGNKSLDWFIGQETNSQPKYVVTGGLGPDGMKEVSEYLISRGWWAKAEYPGGNKAPYVITGGLSKQALVEFEAWLKARGWYYEVKQ